MPEIPGLPLRAVADLASRPLEEVYRLFRLPTAPAPTSHVACVPVYDARAALTHVMGSPEAADDALSRLVARLTARDAASQQRGPV